MSLLKSLELKGRLLHSEPLCKHTTFRIGGPVDIWAEPRDIEDLTGFLEASKADKLPVIIMGEGSNLLVSDKGLKAAVIHLGDSFHPALLENDCIATSHQKGGVQAGQNLQRFILNMIDAGNAGLEFMAGIPGTVGGAIKMNAGAGLKGPWISDFIERAKVCDYFGRAKWLEKKDLRFGYRDSGLKELIILEAEFNLVKTKNKENLKKEYRRLLVEKKDKQELSRPSAGCIFKNPKGPGLTAARLIEGCGLKSKRIGGAVISERHANFIVNTGKATFSNVMELIELIKAEVSRQYNIMLETEVEILK